MNIASIPGTVILNRDDPDGFSKMPRWEQQQYKSFRAWLMYNVGQPITSLTRAIHDGTLLAKLVANLTGDKITGLEPRPRLRIQCINNVGQCFNYFTKAGLTITNISPEDIVDGNVKLTLGFIWLLILHWGINTPQPKPAEPTPKESTTTPTTTTTTAKPAPAPSQPQHVQQGDPKLLLMDKVNGMYKLTELPFVTSNFTSDWQDGMRFGALLHANDSSLPPNWSTFSPENARQNLEVCFNVFRKELRLPEILSVEDLLDEKPDEKAVMTFVAMIISALNKREQEEAEAAKEEEEVIQPEPVTTTTTTTTTTTPSPSTSSPPQTRSAAPPSQVAALFGARKVEKLGIEQQQQQAQPTTAPSPKKRRPRKKKPEFKGPQVNLRVCQARRLKPINGDPDDESEYPEAYVKLDIKDRKSPVNRATTAAEPSLYPEWHEEFEYAKGELKDEDVLEFNILDKLSDTDFGIVRLAVKDIVDATEREKAFDYWLPLYDRKTGERVGDGEFRIVATTGKAPLPVQTQYMPIKIRVAAGRELKGIQDGLSDPYVELDVPGMRMKKNRTKTCERTVDPEWDEEFFFDSGTVDAEKDVLTLKVFSDTKDKTKVPLGVVQFPFKQCLENPFTDDWFPVKNPDKPDEEGQGDIELVVTYGKDLPPILTKTFLIGVLAARNLVGATSGKSDPYIQIWVPGRKSKKLVLKTKTKKKTSNPVWNQEFEFELDNFEVSSDVMEFHIFDRDLIGENAPLGIVELALKDIIKVAYIDRWFTIYDHKHRSKKGKGEVHMRIAFGKKEKQILLNAFESDRPSKIGPPQTVFYRSKTLTEKWKKEKIEQRYNAAKGLPIRVRIVTATGLPGNPSSFVTTTIPGKKTSHKLKTKTKSGSNAVWNEEFNMSLEPLAEEDSIRFTIKNGGMTGPMLSHVLGQADVAVKDVMKATDGVFTSALPLHNAKGKLDKNRGSLHVLIAFGEGKLPEVIVEGKEK